MVDITDSRRTDAWIRKSLEQALRDFFFNKSNKCNHLKLFLSNLETIMTDK